VDSALGPFGRNVNFDKKYGTTTIAMDGVTVAKEIELPCPFGGNMSTQLVREVSRKAAGIKVTAPRRPPRSPKPSTRSSQQCDRQCHN
jgi:hypothetical protein